MLIDLPTPSDKAIPSVFDRPNSYDVLADWDLSTLVAPGAGDVDLGNTEAAKTIGGNANWFLQNDALNGPFLVADPNGLYISETAGEGIIFGHAAVASVMDQITDIAPFLYISMPNLIGLDKWPAGHQNIVKNYKELVIGCIVDVSASAAAGEHAGVFYGTNIVPPGPCSRGGTLGYGFGTVDNRAVFSRQGVAYLEGEAPLATPPTKTSVAIMLRIQVNGMFGALGTANGNSYPKDWDSNVLTINADSTVPAGSGALLRDDLYVGMYAASGSGNARNFNFKRFTIWTARQVLPNVDQPSNFTVI